MDFVVDYRVATGDRVVEAGLRLVADGEDTATTTLEDEAPAVAPGEEVGARLVGATESGAKAATRRSGQRRRHRSRRFPERRWGASVAAAPGAETGTSRWWRPERRLV
uniref:Uncharacterized protein n=1 Tax=Oryza brachyantha TaxID=4533 RepID=J3L8J5_ORYBR